MVKILIPGTMGPASRRGSPLIKSTYDTRSSEKERRKKEEKEEERRKTSMWQDESMDRCLRERKKSFSSLLPSAHESKVKILYSRIYNSRELSSCIAPCIIFHLRKRNEDCVSFRLIGMFRAERFLLFVNDGFVN